MLEGMDTTAQSLSQELERLAPLLTAALSAGRWEEVEVLQASIDQTTKALRRASAREAKKAQPDVGMRSMTGPSDRDLVIAALGELECLCSPRLVAQYVTARFSKTLKPSAFASLRRDERRAWSSPRSNRSTYIVPALEGHRLTPTRGLVALSDWPLDRRVVGPRSGRVDFLAAAMSSLRLLNWMRESSQGSEAVERFQSFVEDLVRSMADGAPGEQFDLDHVEHVLSTELELLAAEDQDWRASAARRAAAQLSAEEQLWGASGLHVIEGTGT
jgi:hypothetical protein